METIATVRAKFDDEVLKLGSEVHMKHRHPFFVVMRYVYLLLIPLGLFLCLTASERGDQAFGIVFIMSGCLLFLRKYFWQYRLIKGATASPQAGHVITTVFSKEGLKQTSDLHDVDLKWGSFCDRCLSPKALLLYPQKHMYLIFPREGFQTQEDFDAVSKLAAEQVESMRS